MLLLQPCSPSTSLGTSTHSGGSILLEPFITIFQMVSISSPFAEESDG